MSVFLWPLPRNLSTGNGTVTFGTLRISIPSGSDVLEDAATRYHAIINAGNGPSMAVIFNVSVTVASLSAPLSPGASDESYTLEADSGGCSIAAATPWGALRGMETLSQLVDHTSAGHFQMVVPVHISDAPRFKWRGLMLDTGRNFLTPTSIEMALDAMAYSKLNVLHWHISDDQSFPVVSSAVPSLAGAGAFSPKHTYSQADVERIVTYARARGIAVLPELDVPGHTRSWVVGNPQLESRCSAHAHVGVWISAYAAGLPLSQPRVKLGLSSLSFWGFTTNNIGFCEL